MSSSAGLAQLQTIDYLIIFIYFAFVIGVGYRLKKHMVTAGDFLLAGKRIPTWACGIAFMAANLGAIEIMGMAGMASQYGMVTAHFYWLGAIPAMVFLSLLMMPIYYGSGVRSVPEYLQKRFNEHTRAFNAISFAVMTILMSGINLYAMARVLNLLFSWDMNLSIFLAAIVVMAYTCLGGLTSSIYNEVIQFFLIVAGILPITFLGIAHFGIVDFTKPPFIIADRLTMEFSNPHMAHMWIQMGAPTNALGVDWIGLAAGLFFVLSFGYWCTDFLVIQRAMAARDMRASQRAPLIAAFPKIFFPLITVLPGLIAVAVFSGDKFAGVNVPNDMMLPMLMVLWYPSGVLGLGLTALMASFMSGMAANVTAFNTVWTYDIYQSYIAADHSDRHYLWMGRAATVAGIVLSVGAAYLVMNFTSIMEYMQMVFSFFNAPLFATFFLGMFWARTSPKGAFIGLVCGTTAAVLHYFFSEVVKVSPEFLPPYLAPLAPLVTALKPYLSYRTVMAGNFWRAVFAFLSCFAITVLVSLVTKPKPKEALAGLTWSTRVRYEKDENERWFSNPYVISMVLFVLIVLLNLSFV